MLQIVILLVGLGLIVAGVALWSVPSAFVVAGLGVTGFALLWDDGKPRGDAR